MLRAQHCRRSARAVENVQPLGGALADLVVEDPPEPPEVDPPAAPPEEPPVAEFTSVAVVVPPPDALLDALLTEPTRLEDP